MKRIAFGLITPEGLEPALKASTPSPPNLRAKASAIWLRLEFSTQTNSTRLRASATARARVRGHDLALGWHPARSGAARARGGSEVVDGLHRRAALRAVDRFALDRREVRGRLAVG